MSIERDTGVIRFTCDARGCRKNYEYESNEHSFASGWAEAKSSGWVAAQRYERGISTWVHYCPTCKRELGDA